MEKELCTPEDTSACQWTTKIVTIEENVEENGSTLLEVITNTIEFCETCEKVGKTLSSDTQTYLNYRDTH